VRKPDKDLDANTDAQGSHLQHCRKPPALRGRNINHGGTTDLYWQSGLRQDLFMEIASAGAMLRSPPPDSETVPSAGSRRLRMPRSSYKQPVTLAIWAPEPWLDGKTAYQYWQEHS
jgi:hypothetical protein